MFIDLLTAHDVDAMVELVIEDVVFVKGSLLL
jgi:hypothetical protein